MDIRFRFVRIDPVDRRGDSLRKPGSQPVGEDQCQQDQKTVDQAGNKFSFFIVFFIIYCINRNIHSRSPLHIKIIYFNELVDQEGYEQTHQEKYHTDGTTITKLVELKRLRVHMGCKNMSLVT